MRKAPLCALAVAAFLPLACRRADPSTLYEQATAALRAGRLADAAQLIDRGERWSLSPADPSRQYVLAVVRAELEMERSGSLPSVALTAPPAGVSPGLRLRAFVLRSVAELRRSAIDAAEEQLRQAEASSPGSRAEGSVEIALQRAAIRAALAQWPDAASAAEEAIQGARALGSPYWEAVANNRRGLLDIRQQRFHTALAFFERALSAAKAGDHRLVRAKALLNAGLCLARLGQFDQARENLVQAATEGQAAGSVVVHLNAEGELGNALELQGQSHAATKHYEAAIAIARVHSPGAAVNWLLNLAHAKSSLGDWTGSQQALRAAGAIGDSADRMGLHLYLRWNEGRHAFQRSDLRAAESAFREVADAPAAARTLRWQAQAGLGRVFGQRGNWAESDRHFQAALTGVATARSEVSSLSHRVSYLESLRELYLAYARSLLQQNKVEQALMLIEQSRGQLIAESTGTPAPAGVDTYRAQAKALGAVLISFLVTPEETIAWMVTPAAVLVRMLPGEAKLRMLVEQYRVAIEEGLSDPRLASYSPGRELFEILFDGFPSFPASVPFILVPDGPLHALPFAALIAPGEPGRFLVEQRDVAIAPSLSLLPAAWPESKRGGRPTLVIGDPVSPGPEFPRLAHAAEEVRSVARWMSPGAVVLQGVEATPEQYLRVSAADYSVLHFAAHGTANQSSPLDSTIVLSPGAGGSRLSVRDVLVRQLTADVVTVSACRSAGGRAYSSEGLVGFAWGFLGAGARTVVAGLWDVADQSTPTLMDHFYRHLAGGAGPVSALRSAQLAMINSPAWRTPYHWAAFSVYLGPGRGDPDGQAARIVKVDVRRGR